MRYSWLAVLFCLFIPGFGLAQCTPPAGQSLAICSPASGATVGSPVTFIEGASQSLAVSAQWVYLDNVVVFKTSSPQINTSVNASPGQHNLRVQTWSTSGTLYQAGVNITVSSTTGVSITISPTTATLSVGSTQQFSDTVSGTTNNSVSWSVDGVAGGNTTTGTISSTGFYTAPSTTGTHTVKVTSAADTTKSASANVSIQTAGSCTNTVFGSVRICGPANGVSVASPVQFVSQANSNNPISANWVYVDDVVVYKNANTPSVNTSLTMASGSHNVRVQTWDSTGALFKAGVNITVGTGSGISVSINPTSASISTGATQQFTDTVSGSSNTNVSWSVDGVNGGNTIAGTISTAGLYTAPNAAGSHTVTVTSAADTSKSASAAVAVTSSSGVTITINPTSATLTTGGTQQFSDTVSGSSNTNVTWAVDGVSGGNATTGTVSTSGLYTSPNSAGSHTVTVTSAADTTKSASASVTVHSAGSCTNNTVGSVIVCAPANGASVSSPVQFISQANSTNPIVSNWVYVDNVAVFKNANTASVNTSLNISQGTHNVRVQTWDSKGNLFKAGANITVTTGTGVSVSINPMSASVATGGIVSFTATVTGTQNTSVTWLVDNVTGGGTATGTIDASGNYTAPSAVGTHTVTAQSVADSSKTANATVTITASPGFSVHPVNVAITVNQTQQFTASAAANWSVDGIDGGDSTVGIIDGTGLYNPPSAVGSHTITATLQSDSTSSANATVYVENHPGIFTSRYDNQRTGQNTQEVALTSGNVNHNTFGKLFSRSTDGYTFTQPLYVPNVTIPGKGTFNVVYLATEHDSVYAFDADGQVTSPLWHVSFIPSGYKTLSSTLVHSSDPGPETGITGTPAIDAATGTMYLVSQRVNPQSVVETHLHALDITTGSEKFGGPVLIQGSMAGTGAGSVNGTITFTGAIEHSRPGVLLDNGTVYIAFASLADFGNYHGWVFAYDAATLGQQAMFNASPNGARAGIWQAGSGLASDGSAIYFATGNGTFDSNGPDHGDSYVKLSSGLTVLDFFTPFNQSTLSSADLDLGATGLLVPPDQSGAHPHVLVGSGKSGDIYVVDRDSMGHMLASNNSQIVQYLPRKLGANPSGSDQFFGNGAYWNGNLYFVGSVDKLKQFAFSGGLLSTSPVHQSPTVLSSGRSAEPSVSSNGTSNGIVWVIQSNAGSAVLHAYQATDVSQELYNSTQAGSRDTAGTVVKFSTPTVVNGKVFIATRNELDVYGLLP